MKKRFFYLFSLFILLLSVVCSCKDDNNELTPPESSPEITIPSSENLSPVLLQEGGTVSLSFTTTADWTASLVNTRAESWITVTPSSGSKGKNEITITATTNETYDERNATVVLKCGTVSKNIVVTQKQKDALTVTSSKYEVDSKGGNISVEVKANINFEVEVRADWIKQQTEKTRALTTSNLNFTIEPNETGDKREGEIIIKSGELSETVKVYQGFGDFITLTKKDFTIPEEGGNVDIEIKSTLGYEVKMLSDVDWITEIQSRAVSTHTHHYTISPNDTYDSRETKIVFYNPEDESVADTVTIRQLQKDAIVL
ncbi:BACON domain-containing protein, partial [uncultured Phocaeicola sp.]